MAQTSIHFKAVKSTSEIHNKREQKLDYVREDLSHLNESWTLFSIEKKNKEIQDYCKKISGRKLQKNAMPIREGVVVIKENTTMGDLQSLALSLKNELGIETFQIFIHRDEGHYDKESNKWKPNYHAHFISSWQDEKTGKMLRHQRQDYALMQDLCAEILNMERGKKSSKIHINSIDFKIQKKEEELKKIQEKIENKQRLIDEQNEFIDSYQKIFAFDQMHRPEFEDYKKKKESFTSTYEYEKFLSNTPQIVGSYFWIDFVLSELDNYDKIEFLKKFKLFENNEIEIISKLGGSIEERNSRYNLIFKLHKFIQNIDLKSVLSQINQFRIQNKQ